MNMMLFNLLLLIHFVSFLSYLSGLVIMWPQKERKKNKYGLLFGILILVTGIGLVALKYPNINYYKIVPKTVIFLIITVINAVYDKKPLSEWAYRLLLGLSILASLIAVFRV